MSTELKFRCFRPSYGDDNEPFMTKPFTLGNLQDREQFDFTNGMYASWNEFGLEHKDAIVMQYIDWKDKNGDQMCEDDILLYKVYLYLSMEEAQEIEAAGEDYPFREHTKIVSIPYIYDFMAGANRFIDGVEIIGNIHQNPELK